MAQRAMGFSRKPAAVKAAVVEASVPVAAKEPAALRTVALDAAPLLVPYKRHGRLTLRVERVPQLARLSAGRNNGDGTWSLAFDELDGLTYQYPNILKPHTLSLRIMAFEGSDVSTLKILDYSISPDAAASGPTNGPAASETAAAPAARHEKLQDELIKARESLAASEGEQTALRQETALAKAQLAQVQAEVAALHVDKAEGDQRLSAAKVEAALALERARQTWQAEQAAYLDEIEKRADQHLEQAREIWRQESRDELANAEARWKTDQAARLGAAEAALRNQSGIAMTDLAQRCARLETELAAARTVERDVQELGDLRKQLEKAQALFADRETGLVRQHAEAEARWKTDEAERLAAVEATLRNQSAAALADLAQRCARQEAELAGARTVERDAQELAPLRKELEKVQATLAERERDLAGQRAETDKMRQDIQRESALALAEVAERCVLLEKELAQQRIKVGADFPAAGNEIALAGLRESLLQAQTALKQREEEMTRRLAEAEQTYQQAQQASDAALASAKAAWKEEEASRVVAAQTREREESAAVLTQLTQRCETAEQALADARKQSRAAAAHRDDAYVEGLRTELTGLQKTLVAREAELARARASIEQSRTLYSPPPEIPRQNQAWKPLEPEDPPPPREGNHLLREAVLVMLLVAPAILFYPRLVALLPESWQYDLYTLTESHGPNVANVAATVRPVVKSAPVPRAQIAILTHGANVRAAPSGAAAVTSSLSRGAHVTVIDQHGNWSLVEGEAAAGNGARGWVYSEFLSGAPAH